MGRYRPKLGPTARSATGEWHRRGLRPCLSGAENQGWYEKWRLAACAASANLFVDYLGIFWSAATAPLIRFAVITALFAVLAAANYRGVVAGTVLSSVSVTAKLATLAILCAAGLIYMSIHAFANGAPPAVPTGHWLDAILLLFFAYGGYETVLNAAGEVNNPRRDGPFAVMAGILLVTLLYATLQVIVIHVVANPARSTRPLADAARTVLGPAGALLISAGALLSVFGFLSASMLGMPRTLFALAKNGDLPVWLGGVHPRFLTPYVSIMAFALPAWLGALFGSFSWNVTLSAVGRLLYFAAVCAAVPALRRRQPAAIAFRVPGGILLPCVGVATCGLLLTRADLGRSLTLAAVVSGAFANWLWVRRRGN